MATVEVLVERNAILEVHPDPAQRLDVGRGERTKTVAVHLGRAAAP